MHNFPTILRGLHFPPFPRAIPFPEKKEIILQMEKDCSFKGGSILMDARVKNDMAALVEFTKDKEAWQTSKPCK